MSDPWAVQCIEGEGTKRPDGYRVAWVQIGRRSHVNVRQTRVAWVQAWGLTLNPDQVVRHTCDNRGCVNPLHLQVGTRAENTQDMLTRKRHSSQRKTHCPRGHALEGANLVAYTLKVGHRRCRECTNERSRLARKRAADLANQ